MYINGLKCCDLPHTQPAWPVSWLSPWLSLYTPLLFLKIRSCTFLLCFEDLLLPTGQHSEFLLALCSQKQRASHTIALTAFFLISLSSLLPTACGLILEHINLNMWTTVHDISREHASSLVISLFSLSNEWTLEASWLKAMEIPLEVKLSALNSKLCTRKDAS